MKIKYHLTIPFIMIAMLFISCSQGSKLFEGNYIKGKLIILATDDEVGFFEMHNDHDQSYLAIYNLKDFNRGILFQEYYFKIKSYKNAPIAFDIKERLSTTDNIYRALPKTAISYHAFYNHGETEGMHTIGHLKPGLITSISGGGFSFPIKKYPTDQNAVYYGSANHKLLAESYGEGIMFIDSDEEKNIITIDTCHRHGNNITQCRSDFD